ncbi:Os08g0105550 [Oryza sativa Japonica Group]|uniref:Os08g0105550 protein n=1 Tax=Oryza sativa subsp. japonica TaxID=39947 RepID=A0A0P0XAZ0_ORYSJ|nr:Os08g0105550 [Oryza sativa Japonica Group]
MSVIADCYRDANTRSCVRKMTCAIREDDTTRVGTVPRWRSIRSVARSRSDMCGKKPMRCMCPISGSLPGGEGSLSSIPPDLVA